MALDAAQNVVAQGVEFVAVLGQQLGGQGAEDFHPGRVGRSLRHAVALADRPVPLSIGLECSGHQARLAHACGALNMQHLRRAVAAQPLEQQRNGLLFGIAAIQAAAMGGDRVGATWFKGRHVFAGSPLPLAVAQVHGQGVCALVACVRFLGQGLGQHAAQRLRHAVVDFAGGLGLYPGMQLTPVLGIAPGQRQFTEQ